MKAKERWGEEAVESNRGTLRGENTQKASGDEGRKWRVGREGERECAKKEGRKRETRGNGKKVRVRKKEP